MLDNEYIHLHVCLDPLHFSTCLSIFAAVFYITVLAIILKRAWAKVCLILTLYMFLIRAYVSMTERFQLDFVHTFFKCSNILKIILPLYYHNYVLFSC